MNKIYIIIILILLIIIFFMNITKKDEEIIVTNPLKTDESFSVNLDNVKNEIIVQERENNNEIKISKIFIPEESKLEIITSTTTNKNTINYTTKGFTIVPNIALSYTNQASIGIGTRIFYWNEFGINTHINYYIIDKNVSFDLGIDYRLYKLKLKNISIGLFYDTYKTIKGQLNIYFN